MKKTFKYRIKTNKTTLAKAGEVLELCRQLYNLYLEQRKNAWEKHQKSVSACDQKNQLPALKKDFPEFKQVYSQTLQNVVARIDKSFQNFFRRVKSREKPGYPRFKSSNRYDSFTLTYQGGWKLEGDKLTLSKIGVFKVILHRPIEGDIKTVTIRRTSTNKWFVAFSCENVPIKPLPKTGKTIGIDVGCESFLTDSDGRKINNPRFLKHSQDILTKRQQKSSRRKKGSNGRKKAKLLVAKTYEHISNQRKDFHFKVANQLFKENDTIYIEKLNNWKTFRSLNKSMRDVSWFNFFNILRFKAEEAEKEVIEVNPKGTSQRCSFCGNEVPKDLSVRIHSCPLCGLTLDRDINAAINILRLGASLRKSSVPLSPKSSAI